MLSLAILIALTHSAPAAPADSSTTSADTGAGKPWVLWTETRPAGGVRKVWLFVPGSLLSGADSIGFEPITGVGGQAWFDRTTGHGWRLSNTCVVAPLDTARSIHWIEVPKQTRIPADTVVPLCIKPNEGLTEVAFILRQIRADSLPSAAVVRAKVADAPPRSSGVDPVLAILLGLLGSIFTTALGVILSARYTRKEKDREYQQKLADQASEMTGDVYRRIVLDLMKNADRVEEFLQAVPGAAPPPLTEGGWAAISQDAALHAHLVTAYGQEFVDHVRRLYAELIGPYNQTYLVQIGSSVEPADRAAMQADMRTAAQQILERIQNLPR